MTASWITVFALQWMLLVILALLIMGLLNKVGRLEDMASQGPMQVTRYATGDPLPSFTATTLEGMEWSSDVGLASGEPGLLLLATTECQACQILMQQLVELDGRAGPSGLTKRIFLLILGKGSPSPEMFGEPVVTLRGVTTLFDSGQVAGTMFGLRSVPVGISFDAKRRVTSQSRNPHAGWLYDELGVAQPEEPVYRGAIPIVAGS